MKLSHFLSATAAVLLVATSPAYAGDGNADAAENIVYHVNDVADATGAMRNAKNHLNASPKAHIVFVTHSKGIDFLLEGATDAKGNPYDQTVQELSKRGVEFRVCNNTLKGRKIDPKTVVPEATIVPSGVAEISKLQTKAGYAYIKP